MNANEPSEERVERAARKIDPWAWKKFEYVSPYIALQREKSLSTARAALLADAPTLSVLQDEITALQDALKLADNANLGVST